MAAFPQSFLDSVVAIGIGKGRKEREWIGTGFIVGKPEKHKSDTKRKGYRLFLVTNRHVFVNEQIVYIKFNSADGERSRDYPVPLIAENGKTRWIGHQDPDIDVAAIFLSPTFLHAEKREFNFIKSDIDLMTLNQMRESNVTEGDRIVVLGFPMGMVTRNRQYVICRGGVMARVRDYLDGNGKVFLVDAALFPGNSGGPVILCPSLEDAEGKQSKSSARVIGIAKTVEGYQKVAVSIETDKDLAYFYENSGLATVVPSDGIIETMALANNRLRNRIGREIHHGERAEFAEDLELLPEPQISFTRLKSATHKSTVRKKAAIRRSKRG